MKNLFCFLVGGLTCLSLGCATTAKEKTLSVYEVLNKKNSYADITYVELQAGPRSLRGIVNEDIKRSLMVLDEPCANADGSAFSSVLRQVAVIPDQMMSVTNTVDYYCAQSPHPDGETMGLVYDLKTGQRVTLAQQMKSGNTKALDEVLMKKALSKSSNADSSCSADVYKNLGTSATGFSLSATEMTIWTSYPHQTAACNIEATIPLKQLKNFLAPKSVAARVLTNKTIK